MDNNVFNQKIDELLGNREKMKTTNSLVDDINSLAKAPNKNKLRFERFIDYIRGAYNIVYPNRGLILSDRSTITFELPLRPYVDMLKDLQEYFNSQNFIPFKVPFKTKNPQVALIEEVKVTLPDEINIVFKLKK